MLKIFDIDYWQEVWVTIARNKVRSILTGFGVFWGIFMLVILMGAGNGFEGGMKKTFDGFATNSVFFSNNRTSEPYKGYRKGRWWSMNNRDIELIRERAQSVDLISPLLFGGDKNTVRGQKSGTYGVQGVYPAYYSVQQVNTLHGRTFNEIDIQDKRKVCIIGKEVYETLFMTGENPVGTYIRVNGIYFQVIGVISPKAAASIGGDMASSVYIPFSTMQLVFNQGDVIHFLSCTAKSGYPASMVEEEVSAILKNAHDIAPDDTKAIRSFNIEEQFLVFDYLFIGINIVVWFVGLGSLLSGIIGISNIMLVTVRERTREIGVRRALGAKPMAIISQIMNESFVLTTISGLLGLIAGVISLDIVDKLFFGMGENPVKIMIAPTISFTVAIIALLILMLSGIFAGFMPAIRAMSIKAIDAIREE